MELSVVIAVKNGEQYIAEQLRSIQNQTYQDFECILIDDYSDDDTTNIILNQFCKKDDRFKLYVNVSDKSKPYTYLRTHLYEYCSGEYIISLDQDDICLPNCFETLLRYMKEDPSLDAVSGRRRSFYMNQDNHFYQFETPLEYWKKEQTSPNDIMISHNPVDKEIEYFNISPIKMYSLCANIWSNQCYIIKRSAVIDALMHGLQFDDEIYLYCDYIYWLRFMAMGFKVKSTTECVMYYRLHYTSSSHSKRWEYGDLSAYKVAAARAYALSCARSEEDIPYFTLCYPNINEAINSNKSIAEQYKHKLENNEHRDI